MTGKLFLAKYLASKLCEKCENHTLIIAVDHKTSSVRMNFNRTFTSNKFTCATLFWVMSPLYTSYIEPKLQERYNMINHKNCNFFDCDWFKIVLFSTNSLAKLLSDSLLSDSLLLDSLLSDSLRWPNTVFKSLCLILHNF